MTDKPNLNDLLTEITQEQWTKGLEKTRQKEEAEASNRKPGELPIVSTVEQRILEDITDKGEQSK